MAFNILNIGFDGTIDSPFADRTNFVSLGDNNDIFYYLGTNYGTSAWANPTGSEVLISSSNSINSGSFDNLIDDDNNINLPLLNLASNPETVIYTFDFANAIINPTKVDISLSSGTNTSGNNTNLRRIQVSNDNSNWTQIGSDNTFYTGNDLNVNGIGPVWTTFNPSLSGYWKYFRVLLDRNNSSSPTSFIHINEIKIYGTLLRQNGNASKVSIPTTFASLGNVDIDTAVPGDTLVYENNQVTNVQRKIYRTTRLTMSGDISVGNTQFTPNFYVLDPGGANRNFNLPATPTTSQYFRVRNLNTSFEINIREAGTTTIATIGGPGGAGLTQADMWYDGVEWTVISY